MNFKNFPYLIYNTIKGINKSSKRSNNLFVYIYNIEYFAGKIISKPHQTSIVYKMIFFSVFICLEKKKQCSDIHQSDKSIEPKFQLLSFIKHVLLFYYSLAFVFLLPVLRFTFSCQIRQTYIYIFILLNVLFYSIFHPKRQGMTKQNLYGGWYLCAILYSKVKFIVLQKGV